MIFSRKENVFMCLIAFQKMFRKIFFDVWLRSWKYHRKHIFYLLLIFSHIFSVAKRIYNIIHSSIQKHKQNPEKNHQIRTLRAIAISAKARSRLVRCFAWSRLARCFARLRSRSRSTLCAIPTLRNLGGRFRRTISAIEALDDLGELFFLSLSLSFSLALSLFCAWPENGLKVKWKCKTISGSNE